MVFFNYALRKLNAKIVYYGPGLCGKTTNLQWIHDNFEGGDKGKMVSLATEGDRTIFFDLLPIDIGKIRGMDVTLQLYTVPGQVHYNSTRQLVLRGADGVVFVADSQGAMQSSNTDSLKNLDENLGLQGVNIEEFPHVIQFNKRDLGGLMGIEEMDAALNRFDAPFFEAVAVEGIGVQETLEGIVRLVMRSLKGRYEARGLGVEPSRVKPASEGGPWPMPDAMAAQQQSSGIRPLSVSDIPISPTPESIVAEGVADGAETVNFDLEKDPEVVSFESPPVVESAQVEAEDLFSSRSSEDEVPELLVEDQPAFDLPAAEVGPPAVGEDSVFEAVEPVAFEDVDTQTGVLVPSLMTPGLGDFGAEPADLMPSGPGQPVENDDENISVAQYDTADVEEFQNAVPDSGSVFEGSVSEGDGGENAGFDDEIQGDAPVAVEGSPFTVGAGPAFVDSPPQYDVDSLVASVLGKTEGEESVVSELLDGGVDVSEVAEPPEDIEEEIVSEEVEPEEQIAEEVVFEPEPAPVFDSGAQPFSVEEDEEAAQEAFSASEIVDEPAADAENDTDNEVVLATPVDESPVEAEIAVDIESEVVQPAPYRSNMAPVVFDDNDPFADGAWDQSAIESHEEPPVAPSVDVPEALAVAQPVSAAVFVADEEDRLPVSVSAADNSLALKLTGTGAIIESGQVRELDIEVPVPGDWVGNRRVTLQLRLTLSPMAEDENDGTNNPA